MHRIDLTKLRDLHYKNCHAEGTVIVMIYFHWTAKPKADLINHNINTWNISSLNVWWQYDMFTAWLCFVLLWLCCEFQQIHTVYPDSKIHGANIGPTWGRQDPGGPHVGHMNLAIWVLIHILQGCYSVRSITKLGFMFNVYILWSEPSCVKHSIKLIPICNGLIFQ